MTNKEVVRIETYLADAEDVSYELMEIERTVLSLFEDGAQTVTITVAAVMRED